MTLLLSRLAGAGLDIWREQRAVILIVAGYVGLGYGVQAVAVPGLMEGLWHLPTFQAFLAGGACSVPVLLVVSRWRVRDGSGRRISGLPGWTAAWTTSKAELFTLPRLSRLAFVLFLASLFLGAFGRWKLLIYRVQPFGWDPRLSSLDAQIHLGRLPWRILQPVLGHPPVTRFLDLAYVPVLLALLIGITVWQGWTADAASRRRFLLTFVLAWILLGTCLAMALSSAGPCYYGRVTGLPDPYSELMAYLHSVDQTTPLTALMIQNGLWQNHLANGSGSFSEISAMPSIHVAMPTLFALTARRAAPRAAWALAGFAVVIFLGSVGLGWHYAIDGYVGAVGVAAIWWLCGR